jgi:hypothetical protein
MAFEAAVENLDVGQPFNRCHSGWAGSMNPIAFWVIFDHSQPADRHAERDLGPRARNVSEISPHWEGSARPGPPTGASTQADRLTLPLAVIGIEPGYTLAEFDLTGEID